MVKFAQCACISFDYSLPRLPLSADRSHGGGLLDSSCSLLWECEHHWPQRCWCWKIIFVRQFISMLETTNRYSASIDALLYMRPKCSKLSACYSVCERGRMCWLKRTAGAKIFFYLLSIEEPTWPDAKIFWNWAPATALSTGAWTLSLLPWHRQKPTLWPV